MKQMNLEQKWGTEFQEGGELNIKDPFQRRDMRAELPGEDCC